MKLGRLFAMFFILVILAIGAVLFYEVVSVGENVFGDQVRHSLESVSESRGKRIGDVFLEMENDVSVLANFQGTKEVFLQNYTPSRVAAKLNIDEHSNIISKEIENYLASHKYMSLEDLRKNLEFQSIAIRQIGEKGYTVLVNKENFEAEFHHNPNFVGLDYDTVGEEGIQGVSIMRVAQQTNMNNFGFYNWTDPDGEVREKYAYFNIISEETLDGVEFILATTAYVEDYRTVKNVSENIKNYFEEFRETQDYHNLLLISTDGSIIYMANQMDGFGENILKREYFREGLSENFIKTMDFEDVSFAGPFVRHYGESFSKISVMSPVYSEDEIIGVVAAVKDMKRIIDISSEVVSFWSTGENYLVNKDALLITPLRFRYLDLLTQSIKTDNLEGCIEDLDSIKEGNVLGDRKFYEFLNYRGDIGLGVNLPIPKIEWCLLTEVDRNEVLDIFRAGQMKKYVSFFSIIVLLPIAFSFYFANYFNKKYRLEKRRGVRFFKRRW